MTTAPPAIEERAGLEDMVDEARAEIARAIQVAGLTNDPMRHPLEALSVSLAAFPALVQEMHQAATAARHPLSDRERADLIRRLQSAASAAFERQAMESARRLTGAAVAKASVMAATLALIALGAGAAGGYVWGRHSGITQAVTAAAALAPAFRDGVDGADWLAQTVVFNSPAAMAADCERHPTDGGKACTVGVWRVPPPLTQR